MVPDGDGLIDGSPQSPRAHDAGRVNLRTFASASTHKSFPGETNQSPMMLHPHLLVVALTNSHSHVLSWGEAHERNRPLPTPF
jgi:hypothetical protein